MAPYFISALRNELGETPYYRNYANAADGKGAVISYSFLDHVPDGTIAYHGNPEKGFREYTGAEKGTVRSALAKFEAVANVRFQQKNGDTDLQFGQFDLDADTAGYAGYALYDKLQGEIVNGANYGEVWLDSEFILGNIHLVLHEVGHSLGLEHPFEGSLQLPSDEDNKNNTVMSYTGTWKNKLGLYDVMALQSIYGPARKRMDDDTYQFGKDKLIWDGGGTDKISAAQSSKSVTIDLHDGSWNHQGPKAQSFLNDDKGKQVYLGDFTVIENLTGSSQNDRLTGNEMNNRIVGGNGNDRISGDIGLDWLQGGKGADMFVYADLDESTVAKSGRDRVADFSRFQKDILDLRKMDADSTDDTDNAFAFIGSDAFSAKAGELRYEAAGSGSIVSGDVDGDGNADFAIVILGQTKMRESDFLL